MRIYTLDQQSIAVLMMLLQKCILEQVDFFHLLEDLKFEIVDGELVVVNPPESIQLNFELDS